MSLITHYKTRIADHSIDSTILSRWSPRALDPTYEISDDILLSLLEAARWAPSSNNMQPWKFLYAKRGTQAFATICKHLTGFNTVWVPRASVLILALAEINQEGKEIRDLALLGLGQACQNLVLECLSHELHAHQFGGFLRDAITEEFSIHTSRYFLSNIIAVGKQSYDTSWMPETKIAEETPNTRKPLSDFATALS
jgi:nitroreductase